MGHVKFCSSGRGLLSRRGLNPGKILLLSTKIYALDGTIKKAASYPINYPDGQCDGLGSARLHTSAVRGHSLSPLRAYAKVLGDVDGDFNVNIIDFSAVAYADGSRPREAEME